jgi:hypothetical protein
MFEGRRASIMADVSIAVTAEERDFLVHVLQSEMKKHQIEEHRTRTPTYREHVLKEEALLAELLAKLGEPTSQK